MVKIKRRLIFIKIYFITIVCTGLLYGQYTVSSSSFSSGNVTLTGGGFTINSVIGQAIPDITASGGEFKIGSGYILVTVGSTDVTAPVILHQQIVSAQISVDLNVSAIITDNVKVDRAFLYYRQGGDAAFTPASMFPSQTTYSSVIPSVSVGSKGVEYYIESFDENNNKMRLPPTGVYSVQVEIAGTGITKSGPLNSGDAQSAYRLVSIPINLTDKSPAAVFSDDLGNYDPKVWRLFELADDKSYREFSNITSIDPGKAYWLIVKSSGKSLTTGPGKTNPTNAVATIPLKAGWNFIGDPFNFAIPKNNISFVNTATIPDIRSYNGSWQAYTGSLQPFDGYAVYTETADDLRINPVLAVAPQKILNSNNSENIKLELLLKGSCESAKDEDNKIMLITDADENWDNYDKPEPPVIGDYLSIYFPHPEWEKNSARYCVDARPEISDGDSWDFEVKTNINNDVNIVLENLEQVPENFEVWVVNRTRKSALQLSKSQNSFVIQKKGSDAEKLTLLIGSESYIKSTINNLGLIPQDYALRQNYPNPFNPSTIIEYSMPVNGLVTIKIYNAIGQEIATLVNNEEMSAGYHSTTWNGTSSNGMKVSSGVYIYRMISGNFVQTKKMMLLK